MKSYEEIFNAAKDYLKSQISEAAAKNWIEPLQFVSYDDETMVINCGENFMKKLIKENYYSSWKNAFNEVLGFDMKLEFINSDEAKLYVSNEEKEKHTIAIDLKKETFDNFVVGPSNSFAYAAAKAVADDPAGNKMGGGMSYNPLFIYGNSGLGKTHLLNAIANEVKENNPSANIIFVHSEEFTNDFIYHLSNKTTTLFHEKYRKADILIIDDIQFLAGKIQTQEEFFHTINNYIINNKQIIISSDRPPKDIQTLADRIRNRLEAGLLADIQPPELETRIAIIKHKCEIYGINIPDDIITYIAEHVKNNIRQLEGVVKKINAYKEIDNNIQINQGVIQNIISDYLTNNQPIPQLTEKILSEVARTYNITVDDLTSNKRSTNIANPRQIAMYIMKEVTGLTNEQIGDKIGRNHSTVTYSIAQIEKKLKNDSILKAQVFDIIKNIKDI